LAGFTGASLCDYPRMRARGTRQISTGTLTPVASAEPPANYTG
jgi:hypothetical protein